MTDREVMQMALDAFEDLKKSVTKGGAVPENWDAYYEKEYYALEALRQALAQPEQEPVCDKDPYYCGYVRCQLGKVCKNTAPPKREWVGLTDEERRRYNDRLSGSGVAEEIEAKLKEKNGD